MNVLQLQATKPVIEEEQVTAGTVKNPVRLKAASPIRPEPPTLEPNELPPPESVPEETLAQINPMSAFKVRLMQIGEASLSIASSAIGAIPSSVAATISPIKDVVEFIGNSAIRTVKGGYYGVGEVNTLRDLEGTPDRMSKAFNMTQESLSWEARTEEGKRYVDNIGKQFDEIREIAGNTIATPLRIPREMQEEATGKSIDPSAAEAALFAGGSSAIDVILTLAGGRVASKVSRPTTPKGQIVMPTGTPNPVSGLGNGKIKIEALEALPDSKPKFKSPQEMEQRVSDIAQGKIQNEIVVETVEGLPVRVISGQDSLMVLRGMKAKGVQVREAKVRTIERNVLPVDDASAAKVGAAFSADDAALEGIKGRAKRGMVEAALKNFVDTTGNVRKALEKLGPEGHKAVEQLVLRAGATPRAQAMLNDAWYKIYDGLSRSRGSGATIAGELIHNERALFDRFAIAHRIVAIEGSKLGRKKKPNFHGGTTGVDHANWIRSARKELGDEKFVEYTRRAEEYFDIMDGQLRTLYDHGLISGLDYRRMKGTNYLTTRYLEFIDPQFLHQEVGGKTISVGESGLHPFKGGSKKAQLLDTESLLREYVVRVQNRVARNKANQALFKLMIQQPKNGVVSPAKTTAKGDFKNPPQGKTLIRVRVDGKTQGMYMPDWLADGWVSSSPEMGTAMANTLRIISGSALVKPLATGYNPAFALVNIPMDIVHMYLAQSGDYSSFLPMYLTQYGRDVLTVLPDTLLRKGRYEAYINEGGWFDFLTQQGQQVLNLSGGARYVQRHQPKLKLLRDSLGYINQTSEVISRLAQRERVLRNQRAAGQAPDGEAATFAARDRLDFHQGGGVTKGADNIIPYIGAASQVMRTIGRQAKTHPVEFSSKMLQLASPAIGLAAYNMLTSPEVIKQVPQTERLRNYIIVPPSKPFILNEDGTKRYVYYAIRKEPLSAAVYNWLEILTYKYMGDKPTMSTIDYVTASAPITLTNIPTLQAYMSYVSDYNFWQGDDTYGRDQNVDDYAKFTGDTPEVFKNFGDLLNLKPEGLRTAFKSVVPNNAYVQAGTMMYDEVFSDPLEEQEMQWGELLADMPMSSRVYKLTNPYSTLMERENYLPRVENTEHKIAFYELDKRLNQEVETRYEDAYAYAEQFSESDVFLYKDMVNRVTGREVLNEFFKKDTPAVLNLPRGWWLGLVQETSGRRAELYFDAWRDGNQEERQQMESMAGSLEAAGLNFMDIEFMVKFEEMKGKYNVDGPLELE